MPVQMRKRIKIKPKPVYSWNDRINLQNKKKNDKHKRTESKIQ